LPHRAGEALQGIARELDHQNELTIGYAQKNKMSGAGPTTLGVRTNRLRSSLRRSDAIASEGTVTGSIGSNVRYAAVHEYGFDGEVSVRSFVRRNRRGDLFGLKKKLSAAGISYVKSFTRHMHMPARSFIGSSLLERRDLIERALSRAVVKALEGTT
jgi:phage gpG-like protein